VTIGLTLPDGEGIAFGRKLRIAYPDLGLVLLTAASIKDDEFQIIADLDEAAEVRGCGWLPWRAERR
jgi:hypothetical protein